MHLGVLVSSKRNAISFNTRWVLRGEEGGRAAVTASGVGRHSSER